MRISKYAMPLVTIVALLGTVAVGKALGYWQTSGQEMADPNAPMTSADIRGWMNLEYLSERFEMPLDELMALLGVPARTPAGTPLKELESYIEVSEVRTRIEEALGGVHAPPAEETETEPPAPAAEPTTAATGVVVTATPEHRTGSGPGEGEDAGVGPTPLPPGETLPAEEIKGRMTLREVSEQCDVPLERLFEELGIAADASPDAPLRDLVAQIEGFEVSRVREVVAGLQAE